MQRRRARPHHCAAFHFSFRRCSEQRVGSGAPCITDGFAKRSVQCAGLKYAPALPTGPKPPGATRHAAPHSAPRLYDNATLDPITCRPTTISSTDFTHITFAVVQTRFHPASHHHLIVMRRGGGSRPGAEPHGKHASGIDKNARQMHR